MGIGITVDTVVVALVGCDTVLIIALTEGYSVKRRVY